MRPLMVLLGAFGVVAGLACAVVLQTLPVFLVGEYSWTVLASVGEIPRGAPLGLSLPLLPSLVALPVLGLIVGLVLAGALGRSGWSLTRSSVE